MNIRNPTIDDALTIFKLGSRYFDANIIPYHIWSLLEVVMHLEESHYCFLAEDNAGELIGFSLGASSFNGDARMCHVEWTAVTEPYLHSGLGVKLFKRVSKALLTACSGELVADTCQNNKTANKIMVHAGFEKVRGVNYFVKKLEYGVFVSE